MRKQGAAAFTYSPPHSSTSAMVYTIHTKIKHTLHTDNQKGHTPPQLFPWRLLLDDAPKASSKFWRNASFLVFTHTHIHSHIHIKMPKGLVCLRKTNTNMYIRKTLTKAHTHTHTHTVPSPLVCVCECVSSTKHTLLEHKQKQM